MNTPSNPPPSKPPSPPRHRPSDLPALDDGEVDFALPADQAVTEGLIASGNSDFSNIPQAQLYDLNQLLLDESVPKGPLIGDVLPIESLRAEYKRGYTNFVKQIDWLESKGFSKIRRTRGDGDCFYRSIAFAFVEQLLNSSDKELAVGRALSILEDTIPMLKNVGFEAFAYEDFYETLVSLVRDVVAQGSHKQALTPAALLEKFQAVEDSNYIVGYLRMVTSAQIRIASEDFEAFLFDPETAEQLTTKEFCERFVDPFGKEADHVQITALCRALKLNINVAYLDGRLRPDNPVDFVPIHSADDDVKPLTLLYRPGHYDILMKG